MKVSSINQNPIVNVELSSLFKMQIASFMADTLEDVVNVFVHCSHYIELCFLGVGGEFVFIIKVYGARIKAIETAAEGEFVSSGGCGIIGKFCKW